MKRAIFLDRDGVINRAIRRGTPVSPEKSIYTAPFRLAEFSLFPDVAQALEAAKAANFLTIIVTNQPDVHYGNMTPEDFEEVMAATRALKLDDIFFCPHGRRAGCDCKKPKPGLIIAAARKWGIDLAKSFMIGDTVSDLAAGKAAGCRTVLILHPYNQAIRRQADFTARDLGEAITLIQGASE